MPAKSVGYSTLTRTDFSNLRLMCNLPYNVVIAVFR